MTQSPFRWLALLLLIQLVGCGGPFLMIPGGALSGEVVSEPVDDWSFVDSTFLELETRPGDPYSVQLNYIVRDGDLFIDPAEGKIWFDHLRADPRVRVRFGNKIYPLRATLIGEPGRLDGFDPDRYIYRLDPRRDSD